MPESGSVRGYQVIMVAFRSASLAEAALIEMLTNMSNNISYYSSMVLRELSASSFDPNVARKLYNQEVQVLKNKSEEIKLRILEYIVNGRTSLIPLREFYVNIALELDLAVQKFESAFFRLILLNEKRPESKKGFMDIVREEYLTLIRMFLDSVENLNSMLKLLISQARSEAKKVAEERFNRIIQLEGEADEVYRRILFNVVSEFESDPAALILAKESAELLEDAVDRIYNAGHYARLLFMES